MAKRLRVKNKKRRLDIQKTTLSGLLYVGHKVAEERSKKAQFRKIARMV